ARPRCARVISIPFAPPKGGSARVAPTLLRSWLSPLPVHFWRWRVPALRREVTRLLTAGEADLCVADFLYATPNVPPAGPVPVVLFAHNVEHMIWKRRSGVEPRAWVRAVLELEWRKVRRWEARACAQAALTVAASEADRAGVCVTGTVDAVRPFVAAAAVYVVPLRIGGGTRLKIFEALAMGKAVVSTPVGAEGLPLEPGVHYLSAGGPAEFARAVVSLLRDPSRRQALGTAGRRLVEERFSWSHVAREFEARCTDIVDAARQAGGPQRRSVRSCA